MGDCVREQIINNMQPKYKVYVNNPQEHTADERIIYEQITKKISGMYDRIFDKNSNIPFYVYLFLNQQPNSAIEWKSISDRLSYKIEIDKQNVLDREAFSAEIKGVLKNLNIPGSIRYVYLFITNQVMSDEDFFVERPDAGAEEKTRIAKFRAVKPLYSIDDVIMNEDERIALYKALAIIEHKELIFNKWNYKQVDRSTKSILCFHGAPGTGKTMCAHGVANYLGKKILLCSYNQVQSMYVGEGVKNLKACFDAAEEQDAVLFIDEADTFLSKRLPASNENSKIYNSMSNELFQYVESFNGCLIFASNHIQDFDPAILSRIIQPLEFRLPEKDARIAIIKKLLPTEVPIQITNEQLDELSHSIDGFSGRDIRKSVLLFLSASAYLHKTINKENDADISLSFEEFNESFRLIKKEKEKLRKSKNLAGDIAIIAIENQKREERLMTCAALALWSEEKLSTKGEIIFKEMSKKYDTKIVIRDKSTFCTLSELVSQKMSKQERVQLLDIAVRVLAAEGPITIAKKSFITNLSIGLGLNVQNTEPLLSYFAKLNALEIEWEEICSYFGKNEYDILEELKKEYTEGAAYFHLAKMFDKGSSKPFIISPNREKAEYFYKKAREKGYDIESPIREEIG